MNNFKCIICKNNYTGYGHNPYPIKKDGRCCDNCNYLYVIKERLNKLLTKIDIIHNK